MELGCNSNFQESSYDQEKNDKNHDETSDTKSVETFFCEQVQEEVVAKSAPLNDHVKQLLVLVAFGSCRVVTYSNLSNFSIIVI